MTEWAEGAPLLRVIAKSIEGLNSVLPERRPAVAALKGRYPAKLTISGFYACGSSEAGASHRQSIASGSQLNWRVQCSPTPNRRVAGLMMNPDPASRKKPTRSTLPLRGLACPPWSYSISSTADSSMAGWWRGANRAGLGVGYMAIWACTCCFMISGCQSHVGATPRPSASRVARLYPAHWVARCCRLPHSPAAGVPCTFSVELVQTCWAISCHPPDLGRQEPPCRRWRLLVAGDRVPVLPDHAGPDRGDTVCPHPSASRPAGCCHVRSTPADSGRNYRLDCWVDGRRWSVPACWSSTGIRERGLERQTAILMLWWCHFPGGRACHRAPGLAGPEGRQEWSDRCC